MTLESGTQTAVAVQYGDDEWCQLSQRVGLGPHRRPNCARSPSSSRHWSVPTASRPSRSRNTLTAVWVWFAGKGSFRLDNVRVE